MDKFAITGGTPLQGEIPTGGSKNSALPALAAALLTEEPVILKRIPRVRDIRTIERLLVDIGSTVEAQGETVRLHTPQIVCPEAPYELVKTMRASSLVLGPLVARCGRARVSLPGGCAIGDRPINLHIFGLEQLGARIHQAHGYIEASAPEGLHGAVVNFDRISVTGTEDLMMAAVLAKGETVLRNAAREPEVPPQSRFIIVSDMKSRSIAGLEQEISRCGQSVSLMPQAWLLTSDMTINALRNTLTQRLGRIDVLFIVDASRNKAAWFNYGPENDARIRRIWQEGQRQAQRARGVGPRKKHRIAWSLLTHLNRCCGYHPCTGIEVHKVI